MADQPIKWDNDRGGRSLKAVPIHVVFTDQTHFFTSKLFWMLHCWLQLRLLYELDTGPSNRWPSNADQLGLSKGWILNRDCVVIENLDFLWSCSHRMILHHFFSCGCSQRMLTEQHRLDHRYSTLHLRMQSTVPTKPLRSSIQPARFNQRPRQWLLHRASSDLTQLLCLRLDHRF